MTPQQILQRDIETLKESIRLNWQDVNTPGLTTQEREDIRKNIKWCLDELQNLFSQLGQ